MCDAYQKKGDCHQRTDSGTLFYWVYFIHIKWCWSYVTISTRLFLPTIYSLVGIKTPHHSVKKTDDLQGKLTTFRSQKYHNQVLLLSVCVCPCVCVCVCARVCASLVLSTGFLASSVVKNLPVNAGDMRHRFDPWVRKIPPWRRKWQPTLVFLPGESQGQRSLEGYSPRGSQELDTTEQPNNSIINKD